MTPSSERAHHVHQREAAAIAYRRMLTFDAQHEARAELAAAKVSPATIEALYPGDFLGGLLAAYKAGGWNSNAGARTTHWGTMRGTLKIIFEALPEHLCEQVAEEFKVASQEESYAQMNAFFARYFPPRFGQATSAETVSYCLWHAYRLMGLREQLPKKRQNGIDQIVVYINRNVLPREEG